MLKLPSGNHRYCDGISHQDTFDLKPEAGKEICGEFNPAKTNVPGIEFCQHLPQLAKVADKLAVLRSVVGLRDKHSSWQNLTGYPMNIMLRKKMIPTFAFALCAVYLTPMLSASEKEKPKFYDPVEKQIEGWTIMADPKLIADKEVSRLAFEALANHLQRIKYIMPADRLAQLRKLRIWIELDNPNLSSMQYHPDRGWLVSHGHDGRLVKHVHIPHAQVLYARRTWAKHPYVILHELSHAYHDQVLGFDHPEIIACFDEAKKNGIYDKVLLFNGAKVRHYGLSNHKEYFAETTEAYFGVNDFYPFVRAELKEHDPRMYRQMVKIWGPIR